MTAKKRRRKQDSRKCRARQDEIRGDDRWMRKQSPERDKADPVMMLDPDLSQMMDDVRPKLGRRHEYLG